MSKVKLRLYASKTMAVDRDKWSLHTGSNYLIGQNPGDPLDRKLCGNYRRLANFGGERNILVSSENRTTDSRI